MDDGDGMHFGTAAEDKMVMALTMAGVTVEKAKICAASMCKRSPTTTFIEVYGRSIRDQSLLTRRNLNVEGLNAFDLRPTKPDGQPWDFCKREDRKLARKMVDEQQPEWIVGAPPCTPFSIWNYAMNYPKMDPDRVRAMVAEGRIHLNFVCSLYGKQVLAGRFDLHEHPATALSWKEGVIEALASDPLAHVVTADQCQYGLVTRSATDRTKLLPALKPTTFLTNSAIMAAQLNKRCKRDHIHQPLEGGRCRDAAFYPAPLVRAILKGMVLQTEEDHRHNTIDRDTVGTVNKIFAMPMASPAPTAPVPWGVNHRSNLPKMDGGTIPIEYKESNFKDRYLDEYTGEVLPKHLIRDAIEDELNYFNGKVWKLSTVAEMEKIPDYILVRSRWAMCNKGDADTPDCRARPVSCELNKDGKVDAFSASTPPLEAKKLLFAKYASTRKKGSKPLRLSFVDICKAYFNAIPERAIYMKLPKEMGLSPDLVARQVRCV